MERDQKRIYTREFKEEVLKMVTEGWLAMTTIGEPKHFSIFLMDNLLFAIHKSSRGLLLREAYRRWVVFR
jgi:hypothetical protein